MPPATLTAAGPATRFASDEVAALRLEAERATAAERAAHLQAERERDEALARAAPLEALLTERGIPPE